MSPERRASSSCVHPLASRAARTFWPNRTSVSSTGTIVEGLSRSSQNRSGKLAQLPRPEQIATPVLLAFSRAILRELRRRGVVRTGNGLAGDWAELLVQRATGGELAPKSERSWDVETPAGERLQVKARVVTDPKSAGQRQLSVFRSWDFEAAVVVLFDDELRVWWAVRLPRDTVKDAGHWSEHVRGWRVMATDDLLGRGEDWTERLTQATTPPAGREPISLAALDNADWPKATLDLVGPDGEMVSDGLSLLRALEANGTTLEEFKALPAYRLALGRHPWLAEL